MSQENIYMRAPCRWRVTVYGYEPVNVVARSITGAMEQAARVFGLSERELNRRVSYALLGPVNEEEAEAMYEQTPEAVADETWPPPEAPMEDWPPPEMREPGTRSRR